MHGFIQPMNNPNLTNFLPQIQQNVNQIVTHHSGSVQNLDFSKISNSPIVTQNLPNFTTSTSNLPTLPDSSTLPLLSATAPTISSRSTVNDLPKLPNHTQAIGQIQSVNNNQILNANSTDKPYTCTYCNRGYSYLASLQQHLKTHQLDYQFQCKSCNKLFNNKQELDEHKKTHKEQVVNGNNPRPHQCETCGKRFTLLENLHRHQMIHSDQRPFKGVLT